MTLMRIKRDGHISPGRSMPKLENDIKIYLNETRWEKCGLVSFGSEQGSIWTLVNTIINLEVSFGSEQGSIWTLVNTIINLEVS
jgi:hypothetical protein